MTKPTGEARSLGKPHVQRAIRYDMIEQELAGLRGLRDGWDEDGAPAPSKEAISRAFDFLSSLREHHIDPLAAEPDADGGAGFWFESDAKVTEQHRTVWLVCKNTGSNFAVLSQPLVPGSAKAVRLTTDNVGDVLGRIAGFLRGDE